MASHLMESVIAAERRLQPVPVSTVESAPDERRTVVICDTQPIMAEGIRAHLAHSRDLMFQQATSSLASVRDLLCSSRPSVLLVDTGFGVRAILDLLADLRVGPFADVCAMTGIVVWGVSVTEADTLHLLQAGVQGILLRNSDLPETIACLRSVASGGRWIQYRPSNRNRSSQLTPRQQRILEMVEQGLTNKDIARELGIESGTVKIHLARVFEKTGVRSRYQLANRALLASSNFHATPQLALSEVARLS